MNAALEYAKVRFILVWINALIIIIPVISFILTGSYIQNMFFPVASDFRLVGFAIDKDNNFTVKMQFYKNYNCKYKYIAWYLLNENGQPIKASDLLGLTASNIKYDKEPIKISLLDQIDNVDARNRPKGRHTGGPWRMEIRDFITNNANLSTTKWNSYYGIVAHECLFLPWTSVSLIGPFDFPDSYKFK